MAMMPRDTDGPPDTGPEKICGHWIGAEQRHCRTTEGVRHYLPGYRCPDHTPRALQGLPEIPPGPGWPADAWTTPSPLSMSSLFDERAAAVRPRTPTRRRGRRRSPGRRPTDEPQGLPRAARQSP